MNLLSSRVFVARAVVIAAAVIVVARLFWLQVVDSSYKESANNNVLRYEVQYPPRGEVYDRNGEFLVQSKEAYDLMVVPRDVRPFDTLAFCRILGVDIEQVRGGLKKAFAYSRRRPSILFKQLPKEVKLKFEERDFKGFYTQYRTVRSYPRKIAGNLLGYVGEVNERIIRSNPYYRSGDYIGMSGMEQAYEDELRGRKGVRITLVDVHGMPKGEYAGGAYDTIAVPGTSVTATIDARLQAFGEELMAGKIGSIVAIEPSTGEILAMVSSPSYDPDKLIGRERSKNYVELLRDRDRPLFNRAVMAKYPPGSIFKNVVGLIGLQEGVLTPQQTYPCSMGYHIGRGMKCHAHPSPLDLEGAIQNSCNAYFCYVFRNIIDNPRYGSVKKGLDVWADYLHSFGLGRRLDSDFRGELSGDVPTSALYDRRYKGRWNSLTVLSLSIGQGELGITPLQMANLGAIIANRGFYHIPHIVRKIDGRDSIDRRFYEKHYTKVDPRYFELFAEAMWKGVNVAGTGHVARVEGLDICGKTGTAQNPHGADHSTFLCFAPKDNPRIAVSVYVEHGRFGATSAAPIASLLIEKYLRDTITRPYLVDYIKNMKINYPQHAR